MTSARVIVEGLRSGIPYRETAAAMTIGREDNLRAVASLMDTVSQGKRPKSWGQVIRAQYGEGKTHLLHAVAEQAWDANWVVSLVSMSKETPLDRLDHVYPKLIANSLRPGSRQMGLRDVIFEALKSPRLLAEAAVLELSERTLTVLNNLALQNVGADELLDDISGTFLSLADLKRIHRENFRKTAKIAATRIKDEIPSYLRLVDWLISRAGYGGWLLLMDEVELIGKFGRGARARSYANLGRFLEGVGSHTVSLWAVAGNFHTDVVVARKDSDQAPAWLNLRPKEASQAPLARLALQELATARPLDPPTSAQLRELVGRVWDLHQAAYQWQAPESREQFYEVVKSHVGSLDARVRTWTRVALSVLDLWFQYGVQVGGVSSDQLPEVDLTEESRIVEDATDDEGVGVSRRRLFD